LAWIKTEKNNNAKKSLELFTIVKNQAGRERYRDRETGCPV